MRRYYAVATEWTSQGERVDVARQAPNGRPEEAELAAVAADAPSSGGFYVDDKHVLHVLVRDIADDGRAIAALAKIRAGHPALRNASVVVDRAQFTFDELRRWRDIVYDSIFGVSTDVTSLDLDERLNRVRFTVAPGKLNVVRAQLMSRFVQVGVNAAAVSLSEQSVLQYKVRPTAYASAPQSIKSSASPIVGGLQIQVPLSTGPGECTAGIVASNGGVAGVVTDSHCSFDQWNVDNRQMLQPLGGRVVAHETVDPRGYQCGVYYCRVSDADFYQLDVADGARGLIARTQYPGIGQAGSTDFDQMNPYFFVSGVNSAIYIGETVDKVGAESGWTSGTIQQTCVDYLDGGSTSIRKMTCQDVASTYSIGGDSGAPVFLRVDSPFGGNEVQLVGILLGGPGGWTGISGDPTWTVFARWDRVVQNVQVGSVDPTAPPTMPTPVITSGDVINGGIPEFFWSPVAGATYYRVWRLLDGANGALVGMVSGTSFGDQTITDAIAVTTAPSDPWVTYVVTAISANGYSLGSLPISFSRICQNPNGCDQ